MEKRRGGNRLAGVLIGLAVAAAVLLLARLGVFEPTPEGHYGAWSLAPAAVALICAFALRQVIPALFIGLILGAIITGDLLAWGWVIGEDGETVFQVRTVVSEYLMPALMSSAYAEVVVLLGAIGGLIGLWTRTGGALHFAGRIGERLVRSARSARVFTWLLGLLFHQGSSISTVLAGTTARPLADRQRVSHEELSYIVDSTASPVATVIPFNMWPTVVAGMMAGATGVTLLATTEQALQFFWGHFYLNFYAFFAVTFTLLFALGWLPVLPGKRMQAAIKRAREEGLLDRPGSQPLAAPELAKADLPPGYRPHSIDFLLPIGTVLLLAVGPFLLMWYLSRAVGLEITPRVFIGEALTLGLLVGIVLALARGMRLGDIMEGVVVGCKGVILVAIILGLAFALGQVTRTVGAADYLVQALGGWFPAALLPAALLGLCMLVAFSTGTSWGTWTVMFPIAMPLAWALRPDDPLFLGLCMGAVLGGGLFGDQCSPISDTTVMSSLTTGCDLMDHVYTQLPMALGAATLAALLSTAVALVSGG